MKHFARLIFIFSTFFFCAGLMAQQAIFRAFTSSGSISKDESFEVTFQIENGEVDDFKPPVFNSFNVLSGPMQSVSTTVINGKVSRSRSYTFTLEPQRSGTFTIGPATAVIDGAPKQSNPVSITVTEGGDNTQIRGSGDVFVRLEPSATVAYPGQQLTLDYTVYTRTDVSSFSLDRDPPVNGAYIKECKEYSTQVKQVKINGQTYISKITRRQVLYPGGAGTLTKDPAVITLGIPDPDEDPFSAMFGSSRPRQVKTNALSVNVKPLPAPVPPDFSGAVGKFTYTCTASTNQLTTDDALKLTFMIRGNGDIKRVKNPAFAKDTLFDIYDPQITGEQELENTGQFTNTRTYEVNILPKVPGEYKLQLPPFVYFDTDAKSYKTIQPDAVVLSVTKGNKAVTDRQPRPTAPAPEPASFWQQNKTWILGGAGGLLALAVALFLAFRKKPTAVKDIVTEGITVTEKTTVADIPPVAEVQPAQTGNYQRGIDEAVVALHKKDFPEFYAALNRTLGQRLSERLQIPFSEFTRHKVQVAAEAKGLDPATYRQIDQLLARLEFANYAHYYQEEEAPQFLEQVRGMLERV